MGSLGKKAAEFLKNVANVLVNPLSVLTPGFLRRVFELGIGLGDDDNKELPELEEPELTQ